MCDILLRHSSYALAFGLALYAKYMREAIVILNAIPEEELKAKLGPSRNKYLLTNDPWFFERYRRDGQEFNYPLHDKDAPGKPTGKPWEGMDDFLKVVSPHNTELAQQLKELCKDRSARNGYLDCYREWLNTNDGHKQGQGSHDRVDEPSIWTSDDGRTTFSGSISEDGGGNTKISLRFTNVASSNEEHAKVLRQLADELTRM